MRASQWPSVWFRTYVIHALYVWKLDICALRFPSIRYLKKKHIVIPAFILDAVCVIHARVRPRLDQLIRVRHDQKSWLIAFRRVRRGTKKKERRQRETLESGHDRQPGIEYTVRFRQQRKYIHTLYTTLSGRSLERKTA